jgi:hypothetical protein
MRKAYTYVEMLVVVGIVVCGIALLIPAIFHAIDSQNNSATPYRIFSLETVEFDNHKWITYRESFVHHPDCPCLTKKVEKE